MPERVGKCMARIPASGDRQASSRRSFLSTQPPVLRACPLACCHLCSHSTHTRLTRSSCASITTGTLCQGTEAWSSKQREASRPPSHHQHQPPTSAASSHPRHPVLCHQYHQRQRHPQCFVRTFSVLALGRSRHQTGGLVRACMWISAATSPQPLVSVLPPRSSRRRKQQPAPTVWATTCQQKATR